MHCKCSLVCILGQQFAKRVEEFGAGGWNMWKVGRMQAGQGAVMRRRLLYRDFESNKD